MANRHLLHLSKLDDFAAWALGRGYHRVDTKGPYEVLRLCQLKGSPVIYHHRHGCDHASFPDEGPADRLVRQWLRARKAATK